MNRELSTAFKNVPAGLTRAPPVTSPISDSRYPFYDAPYPSKDDYPDIRFWSRASYNAFLQEKKSTAAVFNPVAPQRRRGGARLAQNDENVQDDFIENEDGTIVSGSVAAGIRRVARDSFKELSEDNQVALPEKFSHIAPSSRKFVLNRLYAQYPYLRLCADNWKAELILSRVYSVMNNTKARQTKTKVKVEAVVETLPTLSLRPSQDTNRASSTSRKRKSPSSHDDKPQSKRQRSRRLSSPLPLSQRSTSPFIDLTESRPPSPPVQFGPSNHPPGPAVPEPRPKPRPLMHPIHTSAPLPQKQNPTPPVNFNRQPTVTSTAASVASDGSPASASSTTSKNNEGVIAPASTSDQSQQPTDDGKKSDELVNPL